MNFSGKFFFEKRRLMKLLFFILADAVLISLSVWLAFLVRFEGQIPAVYSLSILGIIPLFLMIVIPVFYFLKLYHFSWAYVSTEDLIALFKGTLLSFLLLAATFFVLRDLAIFTGFPRSTLFITHFFIFFFCGGIRFAKRIYLQFGWRLAGSARKSKEEKERTLIVGAGDAGEQILRSILNSETSPYLPIGFIDDNPAKQGALIHGVKVLGKISDIPRLVKEKKIEGLIVALPSAGSRIIREAVEKGRTAKLKKIKILPSLGEIINGQVAVGNLREVQVEDLLGREPVSLDQKSIESFISGKTVLVTGAAGSIGSELCRQAACFRPSRLLILDQDETGIFNISEELEDKFPKLNKVPLVADIRDEEKIKDVFREFRPNIVFHAAAYKHVPLMEENPDEAVKNNVSGTKIVAEAALKAGTENFILISTDKAVNPTSVMGVTKRVGEMICQAFSQVSSQCAGLGTKFISVRFGNVLDSRGSCIPIFREKIKKREPIEITHPEMQRYFMITSEACLLVLQAGAMGKGGEVFILDMGKPIKILDLAKEMIQLSGLEPDKDVPIVFTEPRLGEKLFEEVLTAEEGTIATQNQKILIAKLSQVDGNKLNQGLKKLKTASYNRDKKTIIKILKELVPAYGKTV